ncbi:LPXTG cell wall anchor domain-containing protein [Amycolatopsis alkalitolerans]|uniref:LPXTG cell wall anchor domain-containing protein n=2 Tax=Amycolatopsis alkalitolerans TaxID=2547244 RepID=A0A5C4MBG1_9PSEU|nr:LPXTG cell wall anchor domain-containing protein [Amycolatopsis alkalitolerans]
MRGRPLRAVFTVAVLALGVVLGGVATAQAASEDPRAAVKEGNVTTCEGAGLAGDILSAPADYTYTRGKDNVDQYVDILTVTPGITVTGIVVKGGDAYNLYVPGEQGLAATPPWTALRSPLVAGKNIPQISHWFVCGTKTTTTTIARSGGSTTTTATSETSTAKSSSSGGVTTTSSPAASSSSSAAGVVVTGTTGPGATAANASKLAYTGFNSGWLVGLGAALLLGGAALLFLVRMRRKA